MGSDDRRETVTSKIIFQDVDLEGLTRRATFIVEAEFQAQLSLELHAVGATRYECRIRRILREEKRDPRLQEGRSIVVYQAGWSLHLDLERIFRERGVWKSAPLDRFRGTVPEAMKAGTSYVLFLELGSPEAGQSLDVFELVALNSFTGMDQAAEVEGLLEQRGRREGPPLRPGPRG